MSKPLPIEGAQEAGNNDRLLARGERSASLGFRGICAAIMATGLIAMDWAWLVPALLALIAALDFGDAFVLARRTRLIEHGQKGKGQ